MTCVDPPDRHGESGFLLIEVVVTAALVVLIAVGVLSTIDTASKASGTDRARSQASVLAQEDQERMRAMSPTALAAIVTSPPAPVTRTLPDGLKYTITSTAAWVDDQLAAPVCGGSPSAARYLKIVSSVSWPHMSGASPATEESQVAVPSSGGGITVQVRNRSQAAQANVPVTLTPSGGGATYGPSPTSASPNGCVEWDYLPAGGYTLTLANPGGASPSYVDQDGNTAPTQSVTATDGSAQGVQLLYDQGGTVTAPFWTKIGTNVYQAPTAPQRTDRVTFTQSGLTAGVRIFGTSGTLVNSITTLPLFPFSSPYGVYPGDCTGEDPLNNGQAKDQTVTVTPGGTGIVVPPLTSGDPNGIELPSFNVTVQSSGTAVNNATVVMTRQASGSCSSFRYPAQTTGADPVQTTLTAGRIPYPGKPFGTYTICAQVGTRYVQVTGQKPSWTGTTETLNVTGFSPTGTC